MEIIPLRITLFFIALSFFVVVAKLIRKGKLHEKHALGWFLLGSGVLISGTFPHLVDRVAFYLDIHYPPILAICIGLVIILVQQLHLFILITRNETRIKQLTQEMALLNKLLEELIEAQEKAEKQPSGNIPE
jgi:hypothetical protein